MRVTTNNNSVYTRIDDQSIAHEKPQRSEPDSFDATFVRRHAKAGASLGFRIGSALTIWGMPLSTTFAEAQGKGVKARKAKKRLRLHWVLGLPGTVVGAVGAGIGAATGAIVGKVKLARQRGAKHGQ